MFTERIYKSERRGSIEVICGSMFSGKTEELIRRLRRAEIAKLKVEIFKPTTDKRYHEHQVVSHNQNMITSTAVDSSQNVLLLANDVDVLGIDEAQFFDEGIVEVATTMAAKGTRIIIAGLDMDFAGNPFGPMPALLATADHITKLHAICMVCGDIATFSYRKSNTESMVMLGAQNEYEPRCRNCFSLPKS